MLLDLNFFVQTATPKRIRGVVGIRKTLDVINTIEFIDHGSLTQLVECVLYTDEVGGSSPSGPTSLSPVGVRLPDDS